MRTNLSTLLVLVLACLGAGVQAQAPAPGAAPPKPYPWDMRPRKCFLPDAIPFGQCKANDWPDYGGTKRHVERLLIEPDFDLIQRAEGEVGFSEKQFPNGYYHFDAWFLALDQVLTEPDRPVYQLVDGWTKAKGEGGYAKLAQALVRYGEAWRARGSGTANTVTPEGWDIYRRKLREADQLLDSASDRLKRTGPWYVLKLRIAYQLPELKGSRDKLLEAGSDLWPEYIKIYTTAADFSLPKWGGTYKEADRIARLALKKNKAKWGASWYAIVYQQLFKFQCDCTIAESAADWNLMKRAFRDYEARGRANESVYRAYAGLACKMRDRAETRRLLELADKLDTDRSPASPDPCREFAFSTT